MFTPAAIIAEVNRILEKKIGARFFGRLGLNIDGEVALRAPQGQGYAESLSWFYVVVEYRWRSGRNVLWKTRVDHGPGWQVSLEHAIHAAQARAKAQDIEDKARDKARRRAEDARAAYATEISTHLGGVPVQEYRVVRDNAQFPTGYKWEGQVLGDAVTVAKKLRAIEAIAAAKDLPLSAPVSAMLPNVKVQWMGEYVHLYSEATGQGVANFHAQEAFESISRWCAQNSYRCDQLQNGKIML